MSTNLELLVGLGIIAFSFAILLWMYWSLVLPIFRRQQSFKAEDAWDQFRLLGIKGEISTETKLYAQISNFLEEAYAATRSEGWISIKFVPEAEVAERATRLRALLADMDDAHPEIRKLVVRAIEALKLTYVAQRPFIVSMVIPIHLLAYFLHRAKKLSEAKDMEFAASSLALRDRDLAYS